MSKAPPAFQFYPDAFDQGTDTMTVPEVGGYIRLLNSQWAKGSIPGDDMGALSRIMRCTPTAAKSIWLVVAEKFPKGVGGLYQNERLEKERLKQKARREALSDNGKRGAEAKAERKQLLEQRDEQLDQQLDQQNTSLPSPFLSLEDRTKEPCTTSTNPSVAAVSPPSSSLLVSPKQWAKGMEKHAFYGSRLRVPHVLHDELRAKLGGDNPTTRLLTWYGDLNEEIELSGEPIVDVFLWLRPKFVIWAADAVASAELERFRPKGA